MSSTSSSNHESLLRASFLSASSLMALQLFSRGFTFILNQAMLRMASPRAYGTAAIQFELLLSTILFLSREGVRNALLRVAKMDPLARNLSVLPVFLGFPLALVTSVLYARFAGAEAKSQDYFTVSISTYALAALVELMSEPFHNLAMSELRTSIRVTAEGCGIISKAVVTFLVLLYDARSGGAQGSLALVAFAGGQLAYGIVVLLTYMAHYHPRNIWPKRLLTSSQKHERMTFFEPALLRLSLTMSSQSLVKHFLTEGDKLILSWFSPLQDQGGYAVAVNYGSLVARIVFQPIEEASRVFFSRTLAGASRSDLGALQQSATALLSLLSVQTAFAIIFLVLGTSYIPIALQILLPRQYLDTSAPKVLSAWVWYIPVLAFNGGLEAFLSSVATPHDLNSQSWWMGAFSAVYITVAVTLFRLHLGDPSLVYANMLNLSVRTMYSIHFIISFYRRRNARHILKWKTVIPHWSLFLSAGASLITIKVSEDRFGLATTMRAGDVPLRSMSTLIHIGIGASMALICLGIWWKSAGRYLRPLKSRMQ